MGLDIAKLESLGIIFPSVDGRAMTQAPRLRSRITCPLPPCLASSHQPVTAGHFYSGDEQTGHQQDLPKSQSARILLDFLLFGLVPGRESQVVTVLVLMHVGIAEYIISEQLLELLRIFMNSYHNALRNLSIIVPTL